MSTLMLQMMGSFAQFERSMILKRQAEGIAIAKRANDGRYAGRKASIDRDLVGNMLKAGSSVTAVAKAMNISRQSIYRIKADVGV
jgi:DNA invertase Pin-like site-specific DNA recombinase